MICRLNILHDFNQMNFTFHDVDRAQLSRLGKLGAELFIDTFGHLYSSEDLNAFLIKVYSVDALQQDLDNGRRIVIASDGSEWIGYCKMGPLGLPIDTQGRQALELKQMYVSRPYHGRGVADGLMQEFLSWAENHGAEDLYISCWSENHRALAFYRRYGFQEVAAYTFWVGQHADDERILKCSLNEQKN